LTRKDTRSNFNKGEYTPSETTKRQSLERRGIADIQARASSLGKIYNTWRGIHDKLVGEKRDVRGMACTFVKLFEL
jgi:hypothetical protein